MLNTQLPTAPSHTHTEMHLCNRILIYTYVCIFLLLEKLMSFMNRMNTRKGRIIKVETLHFWHLCWFQLGLGGVKRKMNGWDKSKTSRVEEERNQTKPKPIFPSLPLHKPSQPCRPRQRALPQCLAPTKQNVFPLAEAWGQLQLEPWCMQRRCCLPASQMYTTYLLVSAEEVSCEVGWKKLLK